MTTCLLCDRPIEPGTGRWDNATMRTWHKRCWWRTRWNLLLSVFFFWGGRWHGPLRRRR